MTNGRKALWAVAVILLLMLVVAVGTPNLLRSRIAADQAGSVGKFVDASMPMQDAVRNQIAESTQGAPPVKKVIQNAELGLVVDDVHAAAGRIRKFAELNHGELQKLEITETGGGLVSATLMIRVPASELEKALAELKRLAVRTEREQVSTRDVTREFYDNQAHIRNLRAEEQQYLAIMKQAHTVKDTLEVSQKLSEVRDRIERLQAQIQLMTHDIEMSAIAIVLMQDARVLGMRWRPLYSAKTAVRELLVGLGEWMDWVVAMLIKLPLIVLWVVTVGIILWVVLKIGRRVWLRFLKPKPVAQTQ